MDKTKDKAKTKQQLKTSNYIALMVAISVVVVVLAGYAAKVLGTTLLTNQKVINQKTTASRTLQSDITAAEALSAQYSALGTQAATIKNALPTTADFPGLANAIEAMSSAAGTQLHDVTAQDSANSAAASTSAGGTGTMTQAFTISLSGNYATLDRFLANLEGSARPVHVNDIQISGTNASLTVTIDATTYYQPATSFAITTTVVK